MQTQEVACQYLTRVQFADALGISTSTIDRWRQRGVVAPLQVVRNGKVLYRRDDLDRLADPAGRPPDPAHNEELEWSR